MPSPQNEQPIAIVTGGSAGLGKAIAAALLDGGYTVIITGRNEDRLRSAQSQLQSRDPSPGGGRVEIFRCDVTVEPDVQSMFESVLQKHRRLDVLINNVGTSDRGTIESLQADRIRELIDQNVVSTLLCCRHARAMLAITEGVVINIGSLAAKVGARHLGAYCAAKHALAGLTQQMRLEWKSQNIHVGLFNPGPIKRDDAGTRYDAQAEQDPSLPESARRPGGGANVKGLDPDAAAATVVRMVRKRIPDVIQPGYLRLLIAIGHLSPRLGDWLLLKFTSKK
ncbi:MAG: SDR family oxidoreductase [Planctomycetota bacterium]